MLGFFLIVTCVYKHIQVRHASVFVCEGQKGGEVEKESERGKEGEGMSKEEGGENEGVTKSDVCA